MGKKSSSELTLFLLLITALCLEADIDFRIFCGDVPRTWRNASLYCQQNYLDLVDVNLMEMLGLPSLLKKCNINRMWLGLHRDPENDLVWKPKNLGGVGLSEMNLSHSIYWYQGERSSHCVALRDYYMYSIQCSHELPFYCSDEGTHYYYRFATGWYRAAQICQQYGGHLVTLKERKSLLEFEGWIGLHRKGGETWRWVGDLQYDYRNWAPEQPITADCGYLNASTEGLHSEECSKMLAFACLADNLVVVNENKTWEDALRHCREMHTLRDISASKYQFDLLSLTNATEYSYIKNRISRATTNEVWIGLRFLGGEWWLLNGQKPDHQGTLPDCPSDWKHCGTVSKYDENNWIIRDCSERRNFICYSTVV